MNKKNKFAIDTLNRNLGTLQRMLERQTSSCPGTTSDLLWYFDNWNITYEPRAAKSYGGIDMGVTDPLSMSTTLYLQPVSISSSVSELRPWDRTPMRDRMTTLAHEFRHLTDENYALRERGEFLNAWKYRAREKDANKWADKLAKERGCLCK